MDALIAAWLPGTEGTGLADLLYGRAPFTGRMPVTWPESFTDYQGVPVPDSLIEYPRGAGLSL